MTEVVNLSEVRPAENDKDDLNGQYRNFLLRAFIMDLSKCGDAFRDHLVDEFFNTFENELLEWARKQSHEEFVAWMGKKKREEILAYAEKAHLNFA